MLQWFLVGVLQSRYSSSPLGMQVQTLCVNAAVSGATQVSLAGGRLDIWHILDVNVLGDKALDSLRPLRATVQHHSCSSLGANKERGIVRAGMAQDLELTQTQLRVGLNIPFFLQL